MTRIKHGLVAAAAVLATLIGVPSIAQAQMDTKMNAAQTASMTDGEIRKVDKEAGKVTIKHGEIKNLEMPGMTMVFTAKEKSLLDKVQAGDKVKFAVINDGGKMVVTDIQTVK
ncbi:cation efflux system protein CusF (plasmid) [Comamonadaceae bacterium OS-4]|jgi:Cu(I)/Ag(I) efflux system periplasmic protein CusF|nr:cation efflux system protein CusF [Comamonadaceae bacterium OS-4]